MNRAVAILPLVALVALGVVGAQNLMRPDKPTAGLSENRAAPETVFPALAPGKPDLRFNPPPDGKPVLVNLFASWCAPCRVEHPLLIELGNRHPDQIYGVLYKDTPENGTAFLAQLGNPFRAVGTDEDGQGGLEFGLTGVPETFVIGTDGTVQLHIRRVLTPDDADRIGQLLEGGS